MTDDTIQQTMANTNKLLAEAAKLAAEELKLAAEARKLVTEERKLNIDKWLAPVIVVFGGLGSLIGAAAAVYRLIHG